jgi:hypothetical protein
MSFSMPGSPDDLRGLRADRSSLFLQGDSASGRKISGDRDVIDESDVIIKNRCRQNTGPPQGACELQGLCIDQGEVVDSGQGRALDGGTCA